MDRVLFEKIKDYEEKRGISEIWSIGCLEKFLFPQTKNAEVEFSESFINECLNAQWYRGWGWLVK